MQNECLSVTYGKGDAHDQKLQGQTDHLSTPERGVINWGLM